MVLFHTLAKVMKGQFTHVYKPDDVIPDDVIAQFVKLLGYDTKDYVFSIDKLSQKFMLRCIGDEKTKPFFHSLKI